MSGTSENPDPRNRVQGGDGRFLPSLETAERDAKACRLRSDGYTYPDIARELGYASPGAAYNGVQRAMLAVLQEPAEELRRIELDRLDMLWRAALDVMRGTHVVAQNGRVVELNGQPLKDDAPVLNAIDRLLRIQERRAKLLGLDAPKKIELLTMDVIDAEIARLSAELGIPVEEYRERLSQ